jgi:hypothetical protein
VSRASAWTRGDVDSAFLVTGGREDGRRELCGDLFADGDHDPVELCRRRYLGGSKRLVWDWLLEGGYDKHPRVVPAVISTELVARHQLVYGQERWELSAVRVAAKGDAVIEFVGGWPF